MTQTHDHVRAQLVLVLGGTGKTGRRVAQRLTSRGVPVRLGSRAGDPPFDWGKPAGWPAVLSNVSAAYVSYYPDLIVPGAVDAVRSFCAVAVAQGVERLVLLSGRGEAEAMTCERVVQNTGAEWSIVRASWFSQNFSEDYLLDPVLAGEIALPAGDVAEPFVDAEDIADVAVAALTEAGHAGKIYEVTGPRLLTFADVAAEISNASGREVRYVPLTVAEYAAAAVEHGVPAEYAATLADLFGRVLDGRNAHLTNGVQQALARRPRDFAEYAAATARTGVWNQSIDARS